MTPDPAELRAGLQRLSADYDRLHAAFIARDEELQALGATIERLIGEAARIGAARLADELAIARVRELCEEHREGDTYDNEILWAGDVMRALDGG